MPVRLALASVATPLAFVTAVPLATPCSVNAIAFPLTGDPAALNVADRAVVPPYTPLATARDSVVGVSDDVIVVGSLALLLAGVLSPPPLTTTWFVTVAGAVPATVTVAVTVTVTGG